MNENEELDVETTDTEETPEVEEAPKAAEPTGEKNEKKVAKPAKANEPKTFGLPVLIGSAVAALAIGVVVGHFALGGLGAGNGKTTLAESDLDSTVATYTIDGKSNKITAREAIESTTKLDAVKNEDGTYAVPSADSILSYARNRILIAQVEAEGITVSDDDMKAYAKETMGSDDIETIASQYGMEKEGAEKLLKEAAGVKKLYEKIVDTASLTAPTAPEEGKTEAEYGKYIVGLLGDEWDAKKDTWAKTDGDYYSALGKQKFSSKSATYDQANAAYYVAYQKYSTEYSAASAKWTTYVNERLSKASIQINTLAS